MELSEIVRKYYYNGTVNPALPVLLGEDETIDLVPNNKTLTAIDIGCGAGVLTKRLAEKVGYVLGIDFLDFMIQYAKENHHADNIDYIQQDFLTSDYPEDHYDVVFSTNCFIHIKDKAAILKKIYKILKRGGDFIFCDVTEQYGKKMPKGNYPLNVKEYLSLLNKIGFTNIVYVSERNRIINGEYSHNFYATFKCSK